MPAGQLVRVLRALTEGLGFSKTIDSGTAARPDNPRRLPGIGDETTLNTCSALDQNGARITGNPSIIL
jgi:hypothetical protein